MWRRILFVFLCVWVSFCTVSHAQTLDEPAVPALDNYIVDTTGTLSVSEIAQLSAQLKNFEQTSGSQIFVLMVPTVQPETIETYAVRAFEKWKVGRKKWDDGVLFVIAKNDRRNRLEIGYGLEGAIPDLVASRILKNDVAPYFQKGDFAGGIQAAITRLISLIQKENLPADEAKTEDDSLSSWEEYIPFVMAVIVGLLVHPLFAAVIFMGMGYPVLAFIAFVLIAIVRGLWGTPLTTMGPASRSKRSSGRNPWDDVGRGGGFGGGGFGGGFGGGRGGSSGGGGASGGW